VPARLGLTAPAWAQRWLSEGSDLAVGDHYTIADARITPQLARLKVVTENDMVMAPTCLFHEKSSLINGNREIPCWDGV
jgi:glutathione S-transferase